MDASIKRFQVANGLKVDGVLTPDGETANAMEGNIKKLATQYIKMKGATKPEDKDEWLEDEMNREDDTGFWEGFLNWITRIFFPTKPPTTPDGPYYNPPRGGI